MKIIVINSKEGRSRTFHLGKWSRLLAATCLVALPVVMVMMGYQLIKVNSTPTGKQILISLQKNLVEQGEQVQDIRKEARRKLQALTLKASELQAKLVRLDAMGDRLITMANLDSGEFDFSQQPAVGGPETEGKLAVPVTEPDLFSELEDIETLITDRERQLGLLEAFMANRKLADDVYMSGRPINKGWMSSSYGRRIDPFTGRAAWHEGIDFAGKEEADIIAVAAGLVTWSGDRQGYGEMVEISHSGGYSSRYAHNKSNSVLVGDIVKKGQVIAQMGSSGRSTGPHVHYEVYKHGRPVDPASYVHRTRR